MQQLKSWLEEKQSEYLYSIIHKNEKDKSKKKLFKELADSAARQAKMWQLEAEKEGASTPKHFQPDCRTRIVGFLLKCFSVRQLRFILAAMKVRGMSVYDSIVINEDHLLAHGAASLEQRHKGLNTAGNLRAAVFGVNDGLVSNMSLLLGLVGGGSSPKTIILTGIAGLLAGACSMAAGEYISMRSQREFFEYQIALEKEELELYPQEEAAELAYIYEARGLPKDEAVALANRMISNPEKALDTLTREELGLNPNELGSPTGAAFSSFVAFSVGATIPLLPFFAGSGVMNISVSLILAAFSLYGIGATLSLFTNRSAILSGLRMLLIGALAGASTYFIGRLVGVALG